MESIQWRANSGEHQWSNRQSINRSTGKRSPRHATADDAMAAGGCWLVRRCVCDTIRWFAIAATAPVVEAGAGRGGVLGLAVAQNACMHMYMSKIAQYCTVLDGIIVHRLGLVPAGPDLLPGQLAISHHSHGALRTVLVF